MMGGTLDYSTSQSRSFVNNLDSIIINKNHNGYGIISTLILMVYGTLQVLFEIFIVNMFCIKNILK